MSQTQTIEIPKTEYERLRQKADLLEIIQKLSQADFFTEPPTKNPEKIIKEFQKTGLYKKTFLKSLEKGLKESSYFSPCR